MKFIKFFSLSIIFIPKILETFFFKQLEIKLMIAGVRRYGFRVFFLDWLSYQSWKDGFMPFPKHYYKLKCKQSYPGFELVLPSLFPYDNNQYFVYLITNHMCVCLWIVLFIHFFFFFLILLIKNNSEQIKIDQQISK